MKRWRANLFAALLLLCCTPFIVTALIDSGWFDIEVWERDAPLAAPLAVTSVREGALSLADGRVFRPAGVARRDSVPQGEYDEAIRIIAAQGVMITRDLGDGTAVMIAEPKFYNSCGTRNHKGNPLARWAGAYIQCPVSELLVQTAYAEPRLEQPGLAPTERWRLEGVAHIMPPADSPTRLSTTALRYDGLVSYFEDYDAILELLWKPPPGP